MEDSGDTRSLRSRTGVTAETNVEERRDANVAHTNRLRHKAMSKKSHDLVEISLSNRNKMY